MTTRAYSGLIDFVSREAMLDDVRRPAGWAWRAGVDGRPVPKGDDEGDLTRLLRPGHLLL